MKHTLKWFENRIGKTIYRKKLKCKCESCQKNIIFIIDKDHAEYIYNCQIEMDIHYKDKKIKD